MNEFDVIEKYFLGAMMPDYVSIGPGDDCAVFSVPEGHELCVSTDTLLAGVHFPEDAIPEVAARRAIGANLSDLAAMGAEPRGMTVALTIPSVDALWLESFAAENINLASLHQCPIVGGNLARGQLSITITVFGIVPRASALTRSGARSGDFVYVSGALGAAAGAVAQLGTAQANPFLLERYESPEPRLLLGQKLRGVASSAIDLSDGLLADLSHILKASQLGAELNLDDVPVAEALREVFSVEEARQFALSGGDDYELCFSVNPAHAAQIQELADYCQVAVTRIGTLSESFAGIRTVTGVELASAGYQHFDRTN
ncbi:MAG: thiamine-phosphate kinase [Pseudomonadales bacterium]